MDETVRILESILSFYGKRTERGRGALACFVVINKYCRSESDGFWLLNVDQIEKECGVSVRTQYRIYRELEEIEAISRRSERRGSVSVTYVHIGAVSTKKSVKGEPSDRTGFWQVKEYLKSIGYGDKLNYAKLEELYQGSDPMHIMKQVIKAVDWRNAKKKPKYLTTSQLFVFLDTKRNEQSRYSKTKPAQKGADTKGRKLYTDGGGYRQISL